jgi:hypothetical protein
VYRIIHIKKSGEMDCNTNMAQNRDQEQSIFLLVNLKYNHSLQEKQGS